MTANERFGKFVLLEAVGSSGLGAEYRAAKLGSSGLERIVSLLKFSPAVTAHAGFAKAVIDQAKIASQLSSPNIVKLLAIGHLEASYYLAYELVEGKSLLAMFERSRRDGFPFAVDHALMIASKACAALDYAHAKRPPSGAPLFHGLLLPNAVVVSYDGEIRVRNFGFWAAGVRQAGGITDEEARYLAPEQLAGGAVDARADIFAVGALLFEALVGQPYVSAERPQDPLGRLRAARLATSGSEGEALPPVLAEILRRALANDPADRYADVAELRKAVDAQLFSGEFNPTTFNLAFFMHTLFRDDIEREARALEAETEASYAEYLAELQAPAPAAAPAAPSPPADPATAEPGREAARPAVPAQTPPASRTAPPRIGAPQLALGTQRPQRSPLPVAAVLLALGLAAAGYYRFAGKALLAPPATTTPSTLSPDAAAALERVKVLEARLKAIEEEKAAAEAKAAEEAKKRLEMQAAARGQVVDPAALQRAQDDARRKAQAEQERRQQEERRRLEDAKRAEETRLAEERKRREDAAAAAAAPTPLQIAAAPTTTLSVAPPAAPPAAPVAQATTQAVPTQPATAPPASAPPAAAPAVQRGALVNLGDPGVAPPVAERKVAPQYPPIAMQQRMQGSVELSVLVDEKGNVAEVKLVKGALGVGLNQAAVDSVKKWRYRPATKDGVPVKVWISLRVDFKLPG
jgi:TonB family protein